MMKVKTRGPSTGCYHTGHSRIWASVSTSTWIKCLFLIRGRKDNDSFYGTAYASGYAGIRGNDQKLVFNISARTDANTEFFVPLNSSATVNDYPYIIFIDSNQKKEEV
ncbi:MAG: hypothetical protein MZV63_61475 [Marinilabiliales bacterium]|nr:hypothetical protein [Marinilabiliales bacterium]